MGSWVTLRWAPQVQPIPWQSGGGGAGRRSNRRIRIRISCNNGDRGKLPPPSPPPSPSPPAIQLYSDIERLAMLSCHTSFSIFTVLLLLLLLLFGSNYCFRLLTETVKQTQDAWGGLRDWTEVEVFNFLIVEMYSLC